MASPDVAKVASAPVIALPSTSRHGRVELKSWQPSYAPSLAASLNNRAIWLQLRDHVPSPYTLANAEWWIDYCSKSQNWPNVLTFDEHGIETIGAKRSCHFAIVTQNPTTGEDEAIGSIGLVHGSDVARRTAELGYWLAESHWGMGIMGEVVPMFMQWAWEAFPGLIRVHGEVYATNGRSASVLEKSEFEYEGSQIGAAWKDGRIGHMLTFACLRPGLGLSGLRIDRSVSERN